VAACRLMDRSRAWTVGKANLQGTAACLHLASHTGSNSSTIHPSIHPASQPIYPPILPNINPPISYSTTEPARHLSVQSLPVFLPVYSPILPFTFQSFDCPTLHQSIYPAVTKKIAFRRPGSETRVSLP
jgi:hypothetical protein